MRLKRTVRITVTNERAVAFRPAGAAVSTEDGRAPEVLKSNEGGSEMNSLADALTARFSEGRAGGESGRADTLITAAMALSQAVEALSSMNFQRGAQPPDLRRGVLFYEEVRRFEVALILEALRITRGCQSRAAALLGLNKTTLNSMIKRYGIHVGERNANAGAQCVEARADEPQPARAHVTQDLARSA